VNAVVVIPAAKQTEQTSDLVHLDVCMTFGQLWNIRKVLAASERAPNLSRDARAAVGGMILEIDAALRAAPF